jgi:ankyrin repeat protein
MYAAFAGRKGVAQLLISRGAEVNARGAKGWTALMAACSKCHAGMVALLLAAGADVRIKGYHGTSAQDLALLAKCPEVAEMLKNIDGGGGCVYS